MDSTCLTIIGGLCTAILGLVGFIKLRLDLHRADVKSLTQRIDQLQQERVAFGEKWIARLQQAADTARKGGNGDAQ